MSSSEQIPLISGSSTKTISTTTQATLTWSHINVTCRATPTCLDRLRRVPPKDGQTLLDNISGIARPGQILAILGSSGAGKTTLLNVLSGHDDPHSTVSTGRITVNGHDITRSQRLSGFIIGHVEQREVFVETLSPHEHLTFQVCSSFLFFSTGVHHIVLILSYRPC